MCNNYKGTQGDKGRSQAAAEHQHRVFPRRAWVRSSPATTAAAGREAHPLCVTATCCRRVTGRPLGNQHDEDHHSSLRRHQILHVYVNEQLARICSCFPLCDSSESVRCLCRTGGFSLVICFYFPACN